MGKLTVKMVRFGRRALGLTFGTAMTTSSGPGALGAASLASLRQPDEKVLAAVPRVPAKHGLAGPAHLALNRSSSARLYA